MNVVELIGRHRDSASSDAWIATEQRTWTAREVDARARKLAAGLRELGVEPGDRLAISLPNGIDVLVAYEAAWRAGAAITPMLPALTAGELVGIVEAARPRAVIASDRPLALLAKACRSTDVAFHLIDGDAATTDRPSGVIRLADVEDAAAAMGTSVDRRPDEIAALLFTGGTTGRSKGVMLTHHNLAANAQAVAAFGKYRDGDVNLVSLPLSHSFGLSVLLASCLTDIRMVVMRRFEPAAFLATAREQNVTVADAVPAMLQRLVESAAEPVSLPSLRAILLGGSPCPPKLIERAAAALGCDVLNGYGLTEAGPVVALERVSSDGSVGHLLPGVDVRILDDAGRPAAAGAVGEVTVRSPAVMRGYWQDPEATDAVLTDGWLRTGDLGRLDRAGRLYITGRKKDVIIRNGFNVQPLDVEEEVRSCAGVLDACVVGVADARLGERVVAAVVGSATADAVEAHCREFIAAHKRPDQVVVLDQLPRTSVGKPDRRALASAVASVAA